MVSQGGSGNRGLWKTTDVRKYPFAHGPHCVQVDWLSVRIAS